MKRSRLYSQFLARVREPRRFIQVLAGPRQVGKTTLVRQVMEACGLPTHYESAVGAHLVNTSIGTGISVSYWRERNLEVDFVLQRGDALVAIEVKSGGRKQTLPGIAAFGKAHQPTAKLLVGGQGIPIAEFLQAPASHWLT